MKRFAYYIALLPLVALCACSHNDIDEIGGAVGNGNITIAASLDDMVITRADDTQAERTVEHIDVFAVDSEGNIDYHERNTVGNDSGSAENGAGKLTLSVARRAKNGENYVFAQGETYKFYLVANASASVETMAAITTLRNLQLLVQDDTFETTIGSETKTETLLHLTGTSQGGENTPSTFLMDAVAASGEQTGFVVNPAEGNLSNLELTATFKRAAAKIIVNIKQGADVEFKQSMEEGTLGTAQYDFYKLPSETFVLPDEGDIVDIKLVDTGTVNINDDTFKWDTNNNNQIQIIGYAYAHSWDNTNLTNETSLILNIPMMWNEDDSEDNSPEAAAPNSWYKVPLSKQKMFERNKCYVVNITINAVGATNRSTAIELRDIEYKTLEWQSVGVDVGDSSDDPEFLVLNRDLVEMYNVNFDNSSLNFSSSSPITSVVLKDVYSQNADGTFTSATDNYSAYYVNKFGVKTNLNNTVRGTISASAEQGVLNGGINIISLIRQSSASEVDLALEALGEEPTVPAEPDTEGKPNPNDYLGVSNDYPLESERPTASQTIFNSGNSTYTVYRYNETTGTFQSRTDTCTRSGRYNNYTYSWSNGSWVNIDIPESYNTALNAWAAQHPEYQEYLDAKAKYEAYQTTKTAIENSENVTEETHYNTIRYLEFEVTNEQGLKATFRVMQYPVVYITNIEGYFSYRSDFFANDGTVVHYQNRKAPYLTQAYWASYTIQRQTGNTWTNVSTGYDSVYGDQRNNTRYADGNQLTRSGSNSNNYVYTYTYTEDGISYRKQYSELSEVYDSDVRRGAAYGENDDNPGRSNLDYYYNNNNAWSYGDSKDPGNHRMYHVRITATSSQYAVGRPRLVDENGNYTNDAENGQTADDANNAILVSPSFMLASQLGVTSSTALSSTNGSVTVSDSQYQRAVEQCKNYVETTYDDANGNGIWDSGETVHHYNDWRLPTAAEIAIIAKLQNGSVAVDEVLAGKYYFCASPTRYADGKSSGTDGGFIRCIRDAY